MSKRLKIEEYRDYDIGRLQELCFDRKRELFNLRMKLGMKELNDTSVIRHVRRDIARLQTCLRLKLRGC